MAHDSGYGRLKCERSESPLVILGGVEVEAKGYCSGEEETLAVSY